MDKNYLLTAFTYAILGLLLGIYMASSKDHGQLVTHAHILLLGFVTSFIYAVCYKLWLHGAQSAIAKAQFVLHQGGTFLLTIGLFLLFGRWVPETTLGPVLGAGSVLVLIGMLCMTLQVIKATRS